MARIGKLTAVEVAKAKGPAVLHDGGGLYLRVAPNRKDRNGNEKSGAKSWVFRFQLNGKRRDMGLGPYPDISLSEARGRATDYRKQRHDGIDPLDAKIAQRQAQRLAVAKGRIFRECATEFIEKNRAGWRNAKHRQQWENTLKTYVYPKLGDLPVSAIDTGLVVEVLDPIWTDKPETASRVRGRIEAAGTEPGAVEGEPRACPSRSHQGAEGGAPCRFAVQRDAGVSTCLARSEGYRGAGAGIRRANRRPYRRGFGRLLA